MITPLARRVAVVILNFNGGSLALGCVRQFADLFARVARIIVVDNGSTDGSDVKLSSIPGIEFIQTGRNLGYTGGNNVGIQRALDIGAEYVLVVNNDVEVISATFLDTMVRFMDLNPHIGIAGPKVYFRSQGVIQNTLCPMPSFLRQLYKWPLEKLGLMSGPVSGDVQVTPEVLNGVCILLRGEFLRKAGLMDEAIFMYLDDTDLAIRARSWGYELSYVPLESIVHLQKSVGYDYFGMVDFLLKRNTVYVLAKHGRWFQAVGFAVSSVMLSLIRGLAFKVMRKPSAPILLFAKLLARANYAALRLKADRPSFGPPCVSWSSMVDSG